MSRYLALFRQRLWVWLPALLFLVANLLALVVYQSRFAGRAEVSEEELTAAQRELQVLVERRERREAQVGAIDTTRASLEDFYRSRLSTEEERLTDLIAEIKQLAGTAGLSPSAISYPRVPFEDYGLRKRSFVFSVDGTYANLRNFINLLEVSGSFLTLEQVSLTEVSGQRLRINLRLSTLFTVDGEPPLESDS